MKDNQNKDDYWMRHAMTLAHKAESIGEIPVGAVLIQDDKVIAEGWNQSISTNDPSAHAEMIAIRAAAKLLDNYRLPNTTLYVTLEPCPMCAGLLVHSRIDRLVFGAYDNKSGAAGTMMNLCQHPDLNHSLTVVGGVLANECGEMLSMFFKERRRQKKQQRHAEKIIKR